MRLLSVKILALFVAVLLGGIDVAAAKETRIALVIGNGSYQTESLPDLANPVNDARLMAQTLRSLDFQVIERLDQDQNGMRRSIRDFGKALNRAGDDSVALFFYAGHGIQVRGNNFMLPVKAEIELEGDVSIEAVNANVVLDTLSFSSSRLNFVIIDACRNNPLSRSFRSASRGLARMDAPSGTMIGYATAPGDVAADGTGINSPYTEALTAAMRLPGLTVEQMFRQVRNSVMAKTKDRQVPWESSSLTGGDFYFKPKPKPKPKPVAVQAPAAQPSAQALSELVFWQSIKDSGDASMFAAYLENYPDGSFAKLAMLKRDNLQGQEVRQAEQTRREVEFGRKENERLKALKAFEQERRAEEKRREEERQQSLARFEQERLRIEQERREEKKRFEEERLNIRAAMEEDRKKSLAAFEQERKRMAEEQERFRQLALATPSSAGLGAPPRNMEAVKRYAAEIKKIKEAASKVAAMDGAESGGEVAEVRAKQFSAYGTRPGESREKKWKWDKVVVDELLDTGKESGLLIRFPSKTEFIMGYLSELVIDTFAYHDDSETGVLYMKLNKGTLRFSLLDSINPEAAWIETPNALIHTLNKENKIIIVIEDDGATSVNSLKGNLLILSKNLPEQSEIAEGDTLTVAPNGAIGRKSRTYITTRQNVIDNGVLKGRQGGGGYDAHEGEDDDGYDDHGFDGGGGWD